MINDTSRLLIAMDFADKKSALSMADNLDPKGCRLKVGKEMYTRFGPELVKQLQDKGFEIFLDLKFHDIPNTVAKACAAAADLGVWMLNVHTSGGRTKPHDGRAVCRDIECLAIDNSAGQIPKSTHTANRLPDECFVAAKLRAAVANHY